MTDDELRTNFADMQINVTPAQRDICIAAFRRYQDGSITWEQLNKVITVTCVRIS
jgi:hypothetical protein